MHTNSKRNFSNEEEQELISFSNYNKELSKYIYFENGLWKLKKNKQIPDKYGYSIHDFNFMMYYVWAYAKKEFYRITVDDNYRKAYVLYKGNAYYVTFEPASRQFTGKKFIANAKYDDIAMRSYYFPDDCMMNDNIKYYLSTTYFKNGFIIDRLKEEENDSCEYEVLSFFNCKIIYRNECYYYIDEQGKESEISKKRAYELEREYYEVMEDANSRHTGNGYCSWDSDMKEYLDNHHYNVYDIPKINVIRNEYGFTDEELNEMQTLMEIPEDIINYVEFTQGIWIVKKDISSQLIPHDIYSKLQYINDGLYKIWAAIKKEFYRVQSYNEEREAYVIYEGIAYRVFYDQYVACYTYINLENEERNMFSYYDPTHPNKPIYDGIFENEYFKNGFISNVIQYNLKNKGRR